MHCISVDLEKAYDRVPGEELWFCMRKSGVRTLGFNVWKEHHRCNNWISEGDVQRRIEGAALFRFRKKCMTVPRRSGSV